MHRSLKATPLLLLALAACDGDVAAPATEAGDTVTAAPAGFFEAISAGYYHVCGRTPQGEGWCWGSGAAALGTGDPALEEADRPVRVTGSHTFAAISAGAVATCGLSAGAVLCWGSNQFGQLGNPESARCGETPCNPAPAPVEVDAAPFIFVSAGGGHTCAVLASAAAYCWGYGAYGRLGTERTTNQPLPVRVATDLRFIAVEAGGTHTCGVALTALAYCWGYGEGGQLGTGFQMTAQLTPARVVGGHQFSAIDVGTAHSCALALDAAIWCWGVNTNGQLGNAGTVSSPVPVRAGALNFEAFTTGANHTCGIASGRAYCWGDNEQGQLGDSTTVDKSTPTPVHGDLRFKQLTAGYHFTCGLTTDGAAYCWGFNYRGALGTGKDELNSLTPQRVAQPLR